MNVITVDRSAVFEHWQPREPASATYSTTLNNYLLRLTGTAQGANIVGIGECQPRGRSTGDERDASWHFLDQAARGLSELTLPLGDQSETLGAVRRAMDDLRQSARRGSAAGERPIAFRGTLLGIETAILDLAASASRTSMGELLGAHRHEIEVAPAALPLDQPTAALTRQYLRQQQPSGTIRFHLGDDPATGMRNLLELAGKHPPPDPGGTWWLEARAGLTLTDARDLISMLAKAVRRGSLPRHILLEQPVSTSRRGDLAELQRHADRLGRRRNLDLRIMADESLSTDADLAAVTEDGGCRAINIKAARVGGLLAALDLARTAIERHSETVIALSSMAGSTDVGYWAMQHLALAMPRLDYFTRPPVSSASVNITDSAPEFVPGTRRLTPVLGAGLNVDLRLDAVLPGSGRYSRWPRRDEAGPTGKPLRSYPDERPTQYLSKTAMRSHLVEREALRHGLSTMRYSTTVFVARHDSEDLLAFGASARSPVSGACSFIISDQHKGAAHALLSRAGLPVPDGRVFASSDLAGAVSYAQTIGFPVVTKPVSGTGGAGVSTGLQNPDEVAAGFEAVRTTRFASDDIMVQRHIPGDIYRIVVHDKEVTAALLRVPPSVTGDGQRSVAELTIEKNSFRRDNPRLRKGLITQERTAEYLRKTGHDLDFVPGAGEVVTLAKDAYLNLGGESIDVVDELHPSIVEVAIGAVAAVPELRFCGVDILLEDHRKPIDAQAAGICELNACPELITPQYPFFGEQRFIARRLLHMAAAKRELTLPTEPARELACRLQIAGQIGAGYVSWLARRAREFGLDGWVAQVDTAVVEALVVGGAVPVSTLGSIAISGPRDSAPVSVSTRHVHTAEVHGFNILQAADVAQPRHR